MHFRVQGLLILSCAIAFAPACSKQATSKKAASTSSKQIASIVAEDMNCQTRLRTPLALCEVPSGTAAGTCELCRIPPSMAPGGSQEHCYSLASANASSCNRGRQTKYVTNDGPEIPSPEVPMLVLNDVHKMKYQVGSGYWDIGRSCLYRKAPGVTNYSGCMNFPNGSTVYVNMSASGPGGPVRDPINTE